MNKIIQGDCLEKMRGMPGDSVDLTVTSPPYDNLRSYQGFGWRFESVAKELFRVTKPGGVLVWIVGDATVNGSETGTSFKHALGFMETGFLLHDTMIYQKNSLSFPETNRYYPCFEFMFVLSKGKPKTTNLISDRVNKQAGQGISGKQRMTDGRLTARIGHTLKRRIKPNGVRWNIWSYQTGWNHSYKEKYLKGHPAIMPIKLAEDHIKSWSNPGDLVLDPFLGSGTTALAAKNLNRNYIGIELSEEYVKIAQARLNATPCPTSLPKEKNATVRG